MLLRIGADFYCCLIYGLRDLRENLSNARRCAARAGFSELLKMLCRRPARASVERERHAVFGQVGGGGHKVVDGSETRFARTSS
jgi:hypothetical protein